MRFSCTPINLTPSRSRSHTPCSCHTQNNRYSDDSSKQSTIHDESSAAIILETKLLLNDNNQLRVPNNLGLLEISNSKPIKPIWNKIFKGSEKKNVERQASFRFLKSLEDSSPSETELLSKVDRENSYPGLLSSGVEACNREDEDPAYATLSSPAQHSNEHLQLSGNTEKELIKQNIHVNGIIKSSQRNQRSNLAVDEESSYVDSTPEKIMLKQQPRDSPPSPPSTSAPILSQTVPLLKS